MLAADATPDHFAVVARQHFPDLALTVDALIAAAAAPAVIAALLMSCAADCGAAAREEERREAARKRQQKCRARKDAKRADAARFAEPDLPLSPCHVTRVTRVTPPPPFLLLPPRTPLITTFRPPPFPILTDRTRTRRRTW
jgi:hypothetical protein